MPPSRSGMPPQPLKARKSVRTPVSRIPSTNSKRAHESSLDNNSPQPDDAIWLQTRSDSHEVNSNSKAGSPESDVQPSRRSASSELTSPMMSPGLRALQTSIAESRDTSPRNSTIAYDCFNSQPHLKGHFYSANQLYARGVWIGYLAPDRQSQSFRGLPSFHDLKANYAKFTQPYPPVIQGSPRESRNAVCRGCARKESALIAFSEVRFRGKVKLVIMPLDGDDNAGVFAIMIPQNSDRSLQGLQSYRPWEIVDGDKNSFVNKFMMLTLRNHNSEAGTLETVLAVMSPQERADIVTRLRELPEPRARLSSTPKLPKSTDEDVAPLAPHAMAKVNDEESDAQTNQTATRKRQKVSENMAHKCVASDVVPEEGSAGCPQLQLQARKMTESPADDIQRQASAPADPSKPPPQATKPINPPNIISLELSDEQAERVYFIWPVNDEGMETEFVHTLGECKSFGGLLGLLEEETEDLPSVASILERTKTWKMTYHLGDGVNKAIVARKGTEVAFDRLQATLAQASIWTENPYAKVDIELKSLSRPDTV